jgi:glutamyl-tRNA reductase
MNLLSIGISHHSAPIELRERMWFSAEETRALLPRLREQFFSECVLVSTCNRTELYGMTSSPETSEEALRNFLIRAKQAEGAVEPSHLTSRVAGAAVDQIFKVASGIDSMVIGDIQIMNQVKEAFQIAREESTLGPVLNRLMQSTLHVGKRTRSETSISEGAVSVSYAAVELASKIFADLSRKAALLVGAGETGELALKHLVGKGIGQVRIANRTRAKAEVLVGELGGEVVDYDAIMETLPSVDIVITSVASPAYVLGPEELTRALRQRSHNPLFIIDIGVPRNVNPAAKKIEHLFLYDIDSLSAIVDRNLDRRRSEIPRVQDIIQEESLAFLQWYNSLQVGPTIQELRDAVEQIRADEVRKNINRFRSEDRELVELLTRRIINKILHQPMTTLKQGAENGQGDRETLQRIATLRELFGIAGSPRNDRER